MTKLKKNADTPKKARSLHEADVRTERTYDSQEKKWWVVEWRDSRNRWCPAMGARRMTLEEAREKIAAQATDGRTNRAHGRRNEQWRIVEVVERTKIVEEYGDSSHIEKLTDDDEQPARGYKP